MEIFQELVQVIKKLRHPEEGCPWDLAQTPKSLYPLMIDEAYEIVEAIENEDSENLKEELGDLLLHILLQAEIASETGLFSAGEVVEEIRDKLIRRHPHVFGDLEIKTTEEVLENWEKIKEKEGKKKIKTIFPPGTPSLVGVSRLIQREKSLQIDGPEALQKLKDQLLEMEEAQKKTEDPGKYKALVGELLLSLAQLASTIEVYPEEALREKIKKICNRS